MNPLEWHLLVGVRSAEAHETLDTCQCSMRITPISCRNKDELLLMPAMGTPFQLRGTVLSDLIFTYMFHMHHCCDIIVLEVISQLVYAGVGEAAHDGPDAEGQWAAGHAAAGCEGDWGGQPCT